MIAPTFTLLDAVQGIWRRKLLCSAVFFATVMLVGVATVMCPKEYQSSSTLFVRLGRENVGLDATATLGEQSPLAVPLTREAEINSIAGMVATKQLLEKVVDVVGPVRILERNVVVSDDQTVTASPPGLADQLIGPVMGLLAKWGVTNNLPQHERALIKLQKSLSVEAVDKTNLVQITCETHSPELASEIVETLTSAYLQQHARLNRAAGVFPFLSEQANAVRTNLEDAEQQLTALKNRTGILEVEKQKEVLVQRSARLRDELMQTDATAAGLRAEIESLEAKLGSISATTALETRVGIGNEGVDGMRQQLFALEIERARLLSERMPTHPTVRQNNEQVQAILKKLADEEKSRIESVVGPNAVYDKTNTELILKRAELAANRSRRESIAEQLLKVKLESEEFARHETEFARLSREIELGRENFHKYSQNMLQAKIDSELQSQQISNLSIAEPATFNPKPSFPNKLINLFVGILLGGMNAFAIGALVEYRSHARQSNRRAAWEPPRSERNESPIRRLGSADEDDDECNEAKRHWEAEKVSTSSMSASSDFDDPS